MKVAVEIDDQILEDLFITAFEGGSNYWAEVKQKTPRGEGSSSERWWRNIMKKGGTMTIYDAEEEGEILGRFDLPKVLVGTAKMAENAPEQFANVLSENYDAETADVWFQFVVLGEIVYG